MRGFFIVVLLVLGAIWTLFVLGLWTAFAVGADVLRWMLAPDFSALPTPDSLISLAGWLWAAAMFVMWSVGALVLALIGWAIWRARGAAIVIRQSSVGAETWSPGARPMKDVTPDRHPGGSIGP